MPKPIFIVLAFAAAVSSTVVGQLGDCSGTSMDGECGSGASAFGLPSDDALKQRQASEDLTAFIQGKSTTFRNPSDTHKKPDAANKPLPNTKPKAPANAKKDKVKKQATTSSSRSVPSKEPIQSISDLHQMLLSSPEGKAQLEAKMRLVQRQRLAADKAMLSEYNFPTTPIPANSPLYHQWMSLEAFSDKHKLVNKFIDQRRKGFGLLGGDTVADPEMAPLAGGSAHTKGPKANRPRYFACSTYYMMEPVKDEDGAFDVTGLSDVRTPKALLRDKIIPLSHFDDGICDCIPANWWEVDPDAPLDEPLSGACAPYLRRLRAEASANNSRAMLAMTPTALGGFSSKFRDPAWLAKVRKQRDEDRRSHLADDSDAEVPRMVTPLIPGMSPEEVDALLDPKPNTGATPLLDAHTAALDGSIKAALAYYSFPVEKGEDSHGHLRRGFGMPLVSGTSFRCTKDPFKSIALSAVNDGIADCCDGSDEPDTLAKPASAVECEKETYRRVRYLEFLEQRYRFGLAQKLRRTKLAKTVKKYLKAKQGILSRQHKRHTREFEEEHEEFEELQRSLEIQMKRSEVYGGTSGQSRANIDAMLVPKQKSLYQKSLRLQQEDADLRALTQLLPEHTGLTAPLGPQFEYYPLYFTNFSKTVNERIFRGGSTNVGPQYNFTFTVAPFGNATQQQLPLGATEAEDTPPPMFEYDEEDEEEGVLASAYTAPHIPSARSRQGHGFDGTVVNIGGFLKAGRYADMLNSPQHAMGTIAQASGIRFPAEEQHLMETAVLEEREEVARNKSKDKKYPFHYSQDFIGQRNYATSRATTKLSFTTANEQEGVAVYPWDRGFPESHLDHQHILVLGNGDSCWEGPRRRTIVTFECYFQPPKAHLSKSLSLQDDNPTAHRKLYDQWMKTFEGGGGGHPLAGSYTDMRRAKSSKALSDDEREAQELNRIRDALYEVAAKAVYEGGDKILRVNENGKCQYEVVIGTPSACTAQGLRYITELRSNLPQLTDEPKHMPEPS